MGTREWLATAWFFASLIGGLGLILLGARAAGVGVLGSVGGAIIGMFNGAANMDLFPGHMSIGATAALLICGLFGLSWQTPEWQSPASRTTLVIIAVVVAAMGITSALVIHHLDVEDWTVGIQLLVALDAAFVAFLCLVQPIGAMTPTQPLDR